MGRRRHHDVRRRPVGTVAPALFILDDPFQLVFGVLASILLLGVAERRMGTWRAVLAFMVTGVIGVLGT